MANLLNQLAIYRNSTGKRQIDNITEEAPILALLPFDASSEGFFHKYVELESIDSMDINKPMDAPLRSVQVVKGFRQIELGIIDAMMDVGIDYASAVPGGAAGYFKQHTPELYKQLGQDYETTTIYRSWLAYLLARHNPAAPEPKMRVIDAGGTNNSNYTIMVIRFEPGKWSGLYDPAQFKRGTLVNEAPLHGGSMYLSPQNIPKFGMIFKGHLGNLMASDRNAAAIVNIDAENPALTAKMVTTALRRARVGSAGNTYIFCHPEIAAVMAEVGKLNHLQTTYATDRVQTPIQWWDGARIVTSYNFMPGTETNIVLS